VSEEIKDRFERFWDAYPKKVGKRDALLTFAMIDPDETLLARMLATIKAFSYTDNWQLEGGRYVPLAKNWLGGEHWEDEPPKTGINQTTDAEFAEFWEAACKRPFRTRREE
jgi:hypothetical protein